VNDETGYDEATAVLIVGGGLVGLSAALFLSWRGVSSVLVERHPSISIHPRAWGLYPRTLELFRPVGVADALLTEGAGFAGHNLNGKVESLAGAEIAVGQTPTAEDVSDVSPIERILSLPQDRMEPILLRRAQELGADLRFGVELVEHVQDGTGVTATVVERATGIRRTIRARYLIAADGAHSPVREHIGITRYGPGTFRHQFSMVFRADLEGPLRGRRFAVCQVKNADVEGILGHDDSLHQGTLIVTYQPKEGQTPADFTEARCVELVRAAVGVPDLDVTILSALPWEMAALVAQRFSAGRVFLVGDAAHVIPPVGGYGANTGIQDAHNLAWKLDAVLAGIATPALLDTYGMERQPVAASTTRQAGARLAVRGGFATPEQQAELLDTLTVTFGYQYRSTAIAGEGSHPDDPFAVNFVAPRELTGQPGTRAPHLPIEHQGEKMSTLDLFDRTAVLLTGSEGAQWQQAATGVAQKLEIPLAAYQDGTDFTSTGRPWPEAYGVTPAGAVLVRPDGFVAWRAAGPDPDGLPASVLEDALRRMYSR
jgi:putative polyketide hydroxylase